MEKDKNDPNDESSKLRGRMAIGIQHQNISAAQEEKRLNNKISQMYGVDSDEAINIHVDYHLDRISDFLLKRARKNGMLESMFFKRLNSLNAIGYAYSVAQGELLEMAPPGEGRFQHFARRRCRQGSVVSPLDRGWTGGAGGNGAAQGGRLPVRRRPDHRGHLPGPTALQCAAFFGAGHRLSDLAPGRRDGQCPCGLRRRPP